jgi:hypothetical protein
LHFIQIFWFLFFEILLCGMFVSGSSLKIIFDFALHRKFLVFVFEILFFGMFVLGSYLKIFVILHFIEIFCFLF